MGKGRGKWKKQVTVAAPENTGSSGEEKMIPLKRRGRPLKILKKENREKEETKKIETVIEDVAEENGSKRKRSSETDESSDSVEEENGVETRAIIDDTVKFMGFRQSGSRRKNKPRRAANVGVECYCY